MKNNYRWVVALMVGGLVACAGTAPKATFQQDLAVASQVNSVDHVKVTVDAASGVNVLDSEKTRIAEELNAAIDTKRALNVKASDPRELLVKLTLTRYQKGNAFARAMLAGLGQIHIDGNVTLVDGANSSVLSEFKIAKTFAWGGIYGSSTSMEDIEKTFASGVAASLTGQSDEKKPAKPKS